MTNLARLQQVRAISKFLTEANLMIADLESELSLAVDAEEEALEAQGQALEKASVCDHVCTSDCRREGCNCKHGEWHKEKKA